MTAEGRGEAVAKELGLAVEELAAAATLLDSDLPRIALTRAYFAVFHAARARLFADGIQPKSHGGVQHLFNVHLVLTGMYDSSAHRLLSRLQTYRERADYSGALVLDPDGARKELAEATAFVERVRRDVGGSAAR